MIYLILKKKRLFQRGEGRGKHSPKRVRSEQRMILIQGQCGRMLCFICWLDCHPQAFGSNQISRVTNCLLASRAGFLSDLFYLQNRLLRQHTYPAGEISGQQSN